MKKAPPYLILLGALVIASCGRKSLPPREYVGYVENPANGLLIGSKFNGVSYTLQYQPTDYLVMLQLRSFSVSPEIFRQQYDRFKGTEHFVLHIDIRSWDSLVAKANDTAKVRKGMTDYLDFNIQKDMKLVEGSDTIPCGISEYESSMGMYPYYSFVLGFNKLENSKDREFIYSNKVIGTGNIKLTIKNKDIQNIPKLIIKG